MPTYRIKDWHRHYENNRTRELKKLDWVPMPNKMDGDGYTELVEVRKGEDAMAGAIRFAGWCAIVEVASRCDTRGTLSRQGATGVNPHDFSSLSRISRLPSKCIEMAVHRALSIGWLETLDDTGNAVISIPQEGATLPQEGAPIPQEGALNGREGNGREGNTLRASPAKREPNPMWDAVCSVFNLKPVTKTECSRVGKIVSDLTAKGVNPAEISPRLSRYRTAYPKLGIYTPEGLLKHWDACGGTTSRSPVSALADLHRQLAEAKAASREHAVARLEAEIAVLEAKAVAV